MARLIKERLPKAKVAAGNIKKGRGYGKGWKLTLYIAGDTAAGREALHNLRHLCRIFLDKNHILEVVDLLRTPELAGRDQILAVPTVVRRHPLPVRKVVGNLSSVEQVVLVLGFGS